MFAVQWQHVWNLRLGRSRGFIYGRICLFFIKDVKPVGRVSPQLLVVFFRFYFAFSCLVGYNNDLSYFFIFDMYW